jgi:hypothetical protein
MPEDAPVTSATLEAEETGEADELKDVDTVDAMANCL